MLNLIILPGLAMHLFLDPLINLFYLKYSPPPRSRSTIETFKLQEKTKKRSRVGQVVWFGLSDHVQVCFGMHDFARSRAGILCLCWQDWGQLFV